MPDPHSPRTLPTIDGERVTLYAALGTPNPTRALAMFRETCQGEGWQLVSARVYDRTGRKVLAEWPKQRSQ